MVHQMTRPPMSKPPTDKQRIAATAVIGGALVLAATLGIAAGTGHRPGVATARQGPAFAAGPAPRTRAPVVAAPPVAQAAPAYVVKRVLAVAGPMHHGEWHWSEADAPAGPVIVTVDLKAQTLSVFRAGYEIGTAVILYGADAKPTPLGVFAITQKDAHHVSNIYTGAPMPFMLRLTNDGVSIHGSDVRAGYMTHGCVGVPTAFAAKLFGQVKVGDRVIVTNGEMLDVGQAITAA